jgi:hypothetical protein
MPKIYEYFGLIFFFYSNDHKPIHVHVSYGEYETKLEFIYVSGKLKEIVVKSVRGKKHIPANMLVDAMKFAKSKEKSIIDKWVEFFAKHKKPKFEKITKKI